MNRDDVLVYIRDELSIDADYPFADDPVTCVVRRVDNRKWFGILMTVPANRIGLPGNALIDILNVHCPSYLRYNRVGLYPGYHMNKATWTTIPLDDTVSEDEIKALILLSYDSVAPKARKSK